MSSRHKTRRRFGSPVFLTGLFLVWFVAPNAFSQTVPGICDCGPQSGQPAADVLASQDNWGNPTFIGGITNGGPNSGSVW